MASLLLIRGGGRPRIRRRINEFEIGMEFGCTNLWDVLISERGIGGIYDTMLRGLAIYEVAGARGIRNWIDIFVLRCFKVLLWSFE